MEINVKNKSSTNLESGVFAGGDCANGGIEAVDAVQAGQDGSESDSEIHSRNIIHI